MGTNAKIPRRIIKQIIWILLSIGLVAGIFYGYLWYKQKPETVSGVFETAQGVRTKPFLLELQYTCGGREKGLMFRRAEDFPPDRGMLFIFSRPSIQSFWMKNTIISLDMLFLDKDLKVVGILPNVPPLNQSPRAVEAPSQYVVELNAGMAAQHGIERGAQLIVSAELPRGEECRR